MGKLLPKLYRGSQSTSLIRFTLLLSVINVLVITILSPPVAGFDDSRKTLEGNEKCDAADDEDSVVPFPPSVYELPKLRLLEYNGGKFSLSCNLKLCSITKPITYKWFFAPTEDGEGRELVHEGHEGAAAANSNNTEYHFEHDDLFIHAGFGDWSKIKGYYWCKAANQHGEATSSKCHVDATGMKKRSDPLPPVTIDSGESIEIPMDLPPYTEDTVPMRGFYEVTWQNTDSTELVIAKSRTGVRDGRFIIGPNFNLYVLDARTTDSAKRIQQMFREHGTVTSFVQRSTSLTVSSNRYTGDKSGFFQTYSDYIMVQGQESYITCIPKTKRTVNFMKDGKKLDVTENQSIKNNMFRTEYTLWFRRPSTEDAGKYTCYFEDDESITFDQTVHIISSPQLTCDFEFFVIRTPGKSVKLSCTVFSQYLTLKTPTLYWNDLPFDGQMSKMGLSYTEQVTKNSKWYEVVVQAKNLQEKDTGVLRVLADADKMDRNEVLEKLNLKQKDKDGKVRFVDYRILPFSKREEVAVAVFTLPLKLKLDKLRTDALIGEKNFQVNITIFGSPIPDVLWSVDGKEVHADDPNFTPTSKFSVVHYLMFKTVEQSYKVKVKGHQLIGGKPHSESEEIDVTAHQPLEFDPNMPEDFNFVEGREAKVECAVTQKMGARTGDVKFTWRREDSSIVFSGAMGITIKEGEKTDENGIKYDTSTLSFMTKPGDEAKKFGCNAVLSANGFKLQEVQKMVTVASGPAPMQPTKFDWKNKERAVFQWESERKQGLYDFVDVVEWAQIFKENENKAPEWKELGHSTDKNGQDGYVKMIASLDALTDYNMSELPKGARFKFRLFTKNKFGQSDYADNILDTVTGDSKPDFEMQNVAIREDPNGSPKILVSWDDIPRDKFGSYDATDGVCVNVLVESKDKDGNARQKQECVDPHKDNVTIGWDDTEPYTPHKVTVWYSNKEGETPKETVEGFNYEQPPKTPALSDDQPEEKPDSAAVKFPAVSDEDLNGKFKKYENKTIVTTTPPPEEQSTTVPPEPETTTESIHGKATYRTSLVKSSVTTPPPDTDIAATTTENVVPAPTEKPKPKPVKESKHKPVSKPEKVTPPPTYDDYTDDETLIAYWKHKEYYLRDQGPDYSGDDYQEDLYAAY